jgi:hypothetical protein
VEGNDVSHAAIHARELKIPARVGTAEAIKLLAPYHGHTVTFDATTGTIHLGEVRVIERTKPSSLWREDIEVPAFGGNLQRAPDAASDLPPGAVRDATGVWIPRPRIPYCTLQLDYYRRAFSWYVAWLQRLDWPSGRRGKPLIGPHESKVADGILFVRLPEGEPPERRFMRSLTLDDFAFLMQERWSWLKRLTALLDKVTELNAANVGQVFNALVALLGINSMGHELRTAFHDLCLEPQVRYVAPTSLALMMQSAWSEAPDSLQTDLDREQQKELSSLAMLIRRDPQMARLLLGMKPTGRQWGSTVASFRQLNPAVMDRIDSLSARYKLNTEDMRVLSDTPGYLKLLEDRLNSPNGGVAPAWLADSCYNLWHVNGSSRWTLRAMRNADPDLYLIFQGFAAGTGTHEGNRAEMGGSRRSLNVLQRTVETNHRDLNTIRLALAGYPTLRRTFAIAQSEARFRSNFHHLITSHQRKIAALLLGVMESLPAAHLAGRTVFDLDIGGLTRVLREGSEPCANNKCRTRNLVRT